MEKAEKEAAKAAEKAEKEAAKKAEAETPAAKKGITVLDANGKPRTVKTEEEAIALAQVLNGRIVR